MKKKKRRHYQVKTAHLHGNRCPSMHGVSEPTRQAADSITKTLGWSSRRKEKVLLTAKPNYREEEKKSRDVNKEDKLILWRTLNYITLSVTLFFTCSIVAERDLLCSWEFNLNKDGSCSYRAASCCGAQWAKKHGQEKVFLGRRASPDDVITSVGRYGNCFQAWRSSWRLGGRR